MDKSDHKSIAAELDEITMATVNKAGKEAMEQFKKQCPNAQWYEVVAFQIAFELGYGQAIRDYREGKL